MLKTYKELHVWEKCIRLVKDVYRIVENFPSEEKYGLCSQIRRSAVSIPSNIAEGYGRHSTPDYLRYLNMSMGSLFELETQLIIAFELGFITSEDSQTLAASIDEIERMLSAMKTKLAAKI